MSELPPDPTVKIRAETSRADPDTCKFTVDRTVHPGGPLGFHRDDPAEDAPLIARLFELEDVVYVLVAGTTVTVTKSPAAPWETLRREVGARIRAQILTGQPAIAGAPAGTGAPQRSDAQIRAAIEELLDRDVNPSIAAHGGRITVVEVADRNLLIAMSGGCQGCASSTATLRDGFEAKARLVAPEIVEIIDTTDHAAGSSPYYPSSSRHAGQVSPLAMPGRRR
jgi:NFU1 iron-sulfur cluster scaffold homolog, mitochondrial